MIKSVVACLVGVGVAVTLSSPAAAAPWDSHVHVTGLAYCGGTIAASQITIRSSTETQSASVNSAGYYAMDFANVPNQNQPATAHVTCSFLGTRTYDSQVTLNRPLVGNWLALPILEG
jgi:hypothetical protein